MNDDEYNGNHSIHIHHHFEFINPEKQERYKYKNLSYFIL